LRNRDWDSFGVVRKGPTMRLRRRHFLRLAAGTAALPVVPHISSALDYPARPVHMIVGFAAGSGLDIYARLIAQAMSERLGQSFVIENRLGAGGNIAAETVVNAPPDGYTILMASTAVFTNPWLYNNLSFDFIRDIAPVGSVTRSAFILVTDPSFPPKTIAEFIAYAKANSGKISYGSAGTGTVTHIAGELFKMMASIDMVHVPYRGEPPALNDLIGGRIQLNVGTLAGSGAFIRASKLHALAVTTTTRSEMFPDVPAVAEVLPGYEASLWNGVGAPRATPPEIIAKLNAALNEGLNDPKIKAQFAALGGMTSPVTPAEYGRIIVSETEKWGKVIRAAGIKAE
jgi:tripartite-type tricarboxylate transporter receptor subunit TctC